MLGRGLAEGTAIWLCGLGTRGDSPSVHPPTTNQRTALAGHEIVSTFDSRMARSRLITGTLRCTAVAATMRSGMSGTSDRGT